MQRCKTICIAFLTYALVTISMGTIEELQEQQHTLALYCISCNRWSEANPDWLIQIGKGDQPVA